MTDDTFSEGQKQYLAGFITALAREHGRGLPNSGAAATANAQSEAIADPWQIHIEAQDRAISGGGALTPEERAKRARNPLDFWDEIAANAAAKRYPRGTDVFLHKFHGLFYVAPNQNSYMLRLRLPGGILSAYQARGLADLAERFGGGYIDVTTRANLQIREIGAEHPIEVLIAVDELGLTSRGAGADNIRNITGSPTAGIDPQELVDTRPLCRQLHHHILNHRELYGLPRKFNIALDGGGCVAVLEDTNDIGFAAVRIDRQKVAPPGVYFRMLLGGLTGHGSFARDSGVLLAPHEVIPAAVAVIRTFIADGDRTDRKRARLKYLVERWGVEKFLAEAEAYLPAPWRRLPLEACEPRAPINKHGHIGVHQQSQPGRYYLGIVLPVGRLQAMQLHRLGDIAERYGSATLRLTVWQNLLVSDISGAALPAVIDEIRGIGLDVSASAVRGGIVACTGNAGCKFALADTKRHALALAEYLDLRLTLDQPINIHLTGCPNSCAQHYIGDIGLLATKVERSGAEVEGYHVLVGGGSGAETGLAREIYRSVPADEILPRVESMLGAYLAHRCSGESYHAFVNRHTVEQLTALSEADRAAER